jgi:tetratricopeptide (TPR) repeat protein
MLKNYDRAIDDCNHAIELNPNHTNAFVGRGNARRYKGEYDLAIQDYDRAITLDAKNVNAILGRGLTYEYLKDYRRAVADYDQAIAIDPNPAHGVEQPLLGARNHRPTARRTQRLRSIFAPAANKQERVRQPRLYLSENGQIRRRNRRL